GSLGGGDGQSALHVAVELGDESVVKQLMEAQFDPNCVDKRGISPLQQCVEYFYRTSRPFSTNDEARSKEKKVDENQQTTVSPATATVEVVVAANGEPTDETKKN